MRIYGAATCVLGLIFGLGIGLLAVLPASSQQAQNSSLAQAPAAQASAARASAILAPADAAKTTASSVQTANSAQSANAAPASNAAQAGADKSKDATIVFFREGHFTGSALKPSIFVDGKEIDRLANGRWFSVHAEPGKHELQSSAKNEPATVIETVAGRTTYVQMVILTGNWRGGGRLLQVDAGDAQKVIAKLKPLHE